MRLPSLNRGVLILLAGGKSRRFGSDKAMLRVGTSGGGEAIVAWLGRRLRPTEWGVGFRGGGRWLSVGRRVALPPGAGVFDRWVADDFADEGPLVVMGRLLGDVPAGATACVAAVDMPMMTGEMVGRLVRALRPGKAGAMGVWDDGPRAGCVEPLASVWVDGGALAREVTARGGKAMSALGLRGEVVRVPLRWGRDGGVYLNVNRRGDWEDAAWARRLNG